MFNINNMAMGLLLANNSEKMLKNKQANLPKNWKVRQSLLMSMFPNPTVGMVLHQNEVSKEDQKVTQVNQSKIREATKIIDEINETSTINLPDSIVEKIESSGLDVPSFRKNIVESNDLAWKKQVAYFAEELVNKMVEGNRPKPEEDDLKTLKGVVDEVERVFKENNIKTYSDIEKFGLKYIKFILKEEKINIPASKLDTFVEQAELAKQGKWDELEKFKDL